MNKTPLRSQTTIYIISIYILIFIADKLTKCNFYEWFGIYPKQAFVPIYWYMFFTYSFIHDGFGHLLINSLHLLLVSLIIEPRISKLHFRVLFAGSILIGGILYCLFCKYDTPMIGSGTILSTMSGALIATWIKSKKDFNSLENIYILLAIILTAISLTIGFICIILGKFEGSPMTYTKLLLFFSGFCFIILLGKFNKIGLKEEYKKTFFKKSATAS